MSIALSLLAVILFAVFILFVFVILVVYFAFYRRKSNLPAQPEKQEGAEEDHQE